MMSVISDVRVPGSLKTLGKIAALVSVSLATQLSHATVIGEIEPNDTIATAQNVDGFFSTGFVADIESGPASNDSATVPHVTIRGTGDDTFDIFSFTIATPNSRGIFDIDNAEVNGLDSWLRLFDTDGSTVLLENDDSPFDGPGDQVVNTFNSFMTYDFASTGLYYIEVGAFRGLNPPQEVTPGTAYQLHISIAEPAQVPVPGSLALFAAGLLGAGIARRRRA